MEPAGFSHLGSGSGDETDFCWLFLEIQEKRGHREELLSPGGFATWGAVASLGVMRLLTPLAVGPCWQHRFWGRWEKPRRRWACSLPSPQVCPALAQNHPALGARLGSAVPAVGERQWEGSSDGDGGGVPAVGTAPAHRRDAG